jgi:response regulator NasT
VAEDEALIRMDVVETLRDAGFHVVGEAGDGEQAVRLASELSPDLVILDVKMPVLDGISAAERIGKLHLAPVVLLTAFSQKELVERARDAGFDVVGEAGDGEQAVQLVTDLKPDVVVMDVKMPVLDGISAAERIGKAHLAPVVLLTAFSQKELVERARDAGAMAYVIKPFSPADLLPAVEIAISRYAQISALESEVADLAERFETRKRVDRAKGLLMTKMGLTEPESFRWIQKTSMDRRLTMHDVAQAIIDQLAPKK